MNNRILQGLSLVVSLLCLNACTDSGGVSTLTTNTGSGSVSRTAGGGDDFNYKALLSNIADSIIIKDYSNFIVQGAELKTTLLGYCSAIDSVEESPAKMAAQAGWLALMSTWQSIELHQLGPVNNKVSLRERIHFFGETSGLNSCLVDRNVDRARFDNFEISIWTYPYRGLEAMEYLLFEESLNHSCPTDNDETTAWVLLSDTEKKQTRCQYNQLVLSDVVDAATQIHSEWVVDGGNYRERFIANKDGESIQALSDALFYLEKFTKDIKLGVTTGIKNESTGGDFCTEAACPSRVESPYSQTSLENIRTNLVSFWNIYTGGEGLGFDDLITAKGLDSVNQDFESLVSDALALVDSMIEGGDTLISQSEAILLSGFTANCLNSQANPDTKSEPNSDNPMIVSACSLHGLVKRISDRLRTDLITAVNVSLPQSAQSDAD